MSKNIQSNHTDTLKFVHITDTHLLDQADEIFHSLNTKESLELVLSHSKTHYPDADFILFTGDISQTGSKESYILFESVIQQCDLPIYCVPGNHDNPELLQQVVPNSPNGSISIIKLGNFCLVLLNSWVEGQHHGMISEHSLQQLDVHLQNSQEQFNIIAIHHPPVPINSHWLDQIALQNQSDLLQTLNKHGRNTLLLFGHVHQEFDQQLDQLRLLATPSSCHQFKANSDHMAPSDTSQPAYRYISLNDIDSADASVDTEVHYIESYEPGH